MLKVSNAEILKIMCLISLLIVKHTMCNYFKSMKHNMHTIQSYFQYSDLFSKQSLCFAKVLL